MKKQVEVETKFDVAAETVVPALAAIEHVTATKDTVIHELSATYFDTADLRLSRSKMTLRRRTGGKDAGWHLKLPSSAGRLEFQEALGDPERVPESLLSQVRAIVRSEPLVPIARVDNIRHETVLLGVDGTPVAEFCDDHVSSESYLEGGIQQQWREWEIELTPFAQEAGIGEDLLRSAKSIVCKAGATVSHSPSKLVMALGSSINNAAPGFHLADINPKDPAYAVISALAKNRDKLIEYDPKVRRDEYDSIHQMRVATRELRSHMQTFEGILGGEEYLALEDHLKQLAGILGAARDAEVIAQRFTQLLELEQSEVLDDDVRQHLAQDMQRQYAKAHARVVRTLDMPQYLGLLDRLDAVLQDPPLPETPDDGSAPTPESILIEHLEGAYKRLVRRHKHALAGWDSVELSLQEKEERVHDIRKAAKKLRYAAEAVGNASKLPTGKLYKACKQLQEVLGDFQDAVTSRDKLACLAQQAHRRGESTFGYGVLFQVEHQQAALALAQYQDSYDLVVKAFKKLHKKAKA